MGSYIIFLNYFMGKFENKILKKNEIKSDRKKVMEWYFSFIRGGINYWLKRHIPLLEKKLIFSIYLLEIRIIKCFVISVKIMNSLNQYSVNCIAMKLNWG